MNVPARISERRAAGSADESGAGIVEDFEREGTTAAAQSEGRRTAPKTLLRRQLFGSKSEKRVEIPPEQMTFREQLGLEDPKRPEEPEFELAERGKRGKKSFEGAADESGPGFGPDVPGGTVAIDDPEAAGIPESERGPVGEKVVHRLAQTACTFRIIRYVARTWKRRDTGFLAGMMVDKFCRRPPLHRQHQRLEAAGIQSGRSSPANWMLRSASLSAPIYDAQFRSILESKAVAMDETPIRAGRTGPREDADGLVLAGLRRPRRNRLPLPAVQGKRRGSRPARRLRGHAAFRRQPGLRRLRGISKRRGSARRLPVARPARVRKGEGFRAGTFRRGPGAGRRPVSLRKEDPEKEARRRRQARVPAKPRPSGGRGLLEVVQAPLRGSAPPAEKPRSRKPRTTSRTGGRSWRSGFPTPTSRSTPTIWSAACGSCRSAGRTGSSAGRRSGRKPSGPPGARSPRAGSGASTREPT